MSGPLSVLPLKGVGTEIGRATSYFKCRGKASKREFYGDQKHAMGGL